MKNKKEKNIRGEKQNREERQAGGRLRNLQKALGMELREHKSSFIVYFVLRFLVIVMMVLQILNHNYENVFLCALTLLLLVIPSFVQVTFKIELPTTLEIIILIFIFCRGDIRGDQRILSDVSVLGYGAAYAQWLSCGSDRIFPGGLVKPQ